MSLYKRYVPTFRDLTIESSFLYIIKRNGMAQIIGTVFLLSRTLHVFSKRGLLWVSNEIG